MVVLDTSAVVAIALGEPESAPFEEVISGADEVLIGAPTAVECGIVLSVRAGGPLETWLSAVGAVVVPFTQEHAQEARSAWLRFGRGSGSPARLNYGDVMSYAVAAVAGSPLLYAGDDFSHTDVLPALPRQ
ncbi:MAG TPA: PIN domain nuclease [Micrococcales bacterium]|nr:PIN domain nuclease [Micrococcales bacterium]